MYEVDGKVVLRSPLSHVSAHLLGPKDSKATVTFLRGDQKVVAQIIRQPVPNLMSVQRADTPRSRLNTTPRENLP